MNSSRREQLYPILYTPQPIVPELIKPISQDAQHMKVYGAGHHT